MSRIQLVPVRLLVSMSPYTIGETAGFRKEKADLLVKLGKAEYITPSRKTIRKKQVESADKAGYITK